MIRTSWRRAPTRLRESQPTMNTTKIDTLDALQQFLTEHAEASVNVRVRGDAEFSVLVRDKSDEGRSVTYRDADLTRAISNACGAYATLQAPRGRS